MGRSFQIKRLSDPALSIPGCNWVVREEVVLKVCSEPKNRFSTTGLASRICSLLQANVTAVMRSVVVEFFGKGAGKQRVFGFLDASMPMFNFFGICSDF